jgi:hypothetical protein
MRSDTYRHMSYAPVVLSRFMVLVCRDSNQ